MLPVFTSPTRDRVTGKATLEKGWCWARSISNKLSLGLDQSLTTKLLRLIFYCLFCFFPASCLPVQSSDDTVPSFFLFHTPYARGLVIGKRRFEREKHHTKTEMAPRSGSRSSVRNANTSPGGGLCLYIYPSPNFELRLSLHQ